MLCTVCWLQTVWKTNWTLDACKAWQDDWRSFTVPKSRRKKQRGKTNKERIEGEKEERLHWVFRAVRWQQMLLDSSETYSRLCCPAQVCEWDPQKSVCSCADRHVPTNSQRPYRYILVCIFACTKTVKDHDDDEVLLPDWSQTLTPTRWLTKLS